MLMVAVLAALASAAQMVWRAAPHAARFESMISSKMPTIAFAYDGKACQMCKTLVEQKLAQLPHHPQLKQYMVTWARFDYSQDAEAARRLGLTDKLHLRYYKQSRYIECADAMEMARHVGTTAFDHNAVLRRVHEFVSGIFESFSRELRDVQQLKQVLAAGSPAVVYMGARSAAYKRYYDVATRNTDHSMFHSFDDAISQQVKRDYALDVPAGGDVVCVLRPPDAVTYIEGQPNTCFAVAAAGAELESTIDFEAMPKLRDYRYNERNVRQLDDKRYVIMLYARGEPFTIFNWMQYKKFAKEMPREFIYAFSSAKHPEHAHYAKLFAAAGAELGKEKFYVIRRLSSAKVVVDTYEGKFVAEKMVEFVRDVLGTKEALLQDAAKLRLDERLREAIERLSGRVSKMDEL